MADTNFNILVGTKLNDTIQKQLDTSVKKTVTVKAILDTTGLKTLGTTELTKYEDGLGNVVVASKKFDASGKELNSTIKSVKSTVDTTSQTLQTASKHTKTLGQDFIDTAGKVAKFGAITAIFGLVTTAIGSAVSSVKELDASLTELKKVSDLGGEGLSEYTDRAFAMARDLSTSASNITDATASFVQAGYSLGESEGLSKYAIMLQTIADETMETETATTFLTATMKAFNMTASDAEHIISSVNEVSNQYSVTSNDLSENIGKVAGVAGIAGVSFEELLGLMTSSVEKTRNASKSANAFKSIFINLQQMNASGTMPKLSKQFDEFGISMTDTNGATKNAYDLLNELATVYQKVSASTDVDKQNKMKTLLEDIGGKYNYNVLVSSLSGFSTAISATETAMNSAGSAQEEFDKALDSIAKKSESLKGAFQELVWGSGGLSEFIKLILDGGVALLTFASSDLGGAIIGMTSLIVVLKLASAGFMALNTTIMWNAKALATYILIQNGYSVAVASATASNLTFASSLKLLATTWATTPMGMATIAIGSIIAIATALNKLYESTDELDAKTKELSESTATLKSQRDALANSTDLTDSEQIRLGLLNAQIEANKVLIQQEYEKASASRDYEDTSGATFSNGTKRAKTDVTTTSGALGLDVETASVKQLTDAYGTLTNTKAQSVEQDEEISNKKAKLLELLSQEGVNLLDLKDSGIDLTKSDKERLDAITSITGSLETNQVATQELDESEESLVETTEDLADVFAETMAGFSDIQSAYDTLVSAMDEYNESGVYSLDTVSKLLALDSEYAGALQIVNGQMTINEEAIRNKVLAQAEEAKQTIYNTAIEKLNALASAESGEASALAGDDHSSATSGINAETEALGANTTAKLQNAIADAKGRGAGTEDINQVLGEMSSQLALVNKATLNMGVSFEGSMGKASKSTSKASAETDKLQSSVESLLKEHLEDKIDDLKQAEESEVKVLEDRITLLEKNRDTQLDSIDSQIDGIEKLQDAEESQIDNEISQLEKQKSAVESYYDAQISALEKANTERERQIKLMELEEALSKAKATKVMVMTDTGWQAKEDESAVSSAEQNLSDYQGELAYTTQIEQLEALKASAVANIDSQIAKWEEYKTTMQNNYASQISALETYRTTVEQSYATQIETLEGNIETIQEQYDLQIEQLEVFKDNVDMFVENLSSAEQTRLANQLNTMKATASNYQTDLENLKEYVNKFNSILAVKGSAGATVSTGTSIGSSTANSQKTRGYASGVASVSSNEIAMIGDNPSNRELVIGSKLNGTATMLSQGSGVVNAQSTKSLAGILNTLGSSMGLNGQTMGMNTTNQSNATSQSIQIANITLPSVTNGQGLLDELRGFASGMLQTAYSNG